MDDLMANFAKKIQPKHNGLPTLLVFDISNLLHRTFFANKNLDDITTAGLAHHQALTTLSKYFREVKPNQVIMTYDRANWRKMYTKSEACISGKVYKGNRRQEMTPAEEERYRKFREHLSDFEDMMREHTSVVCLAADLLEADDLMAGVVQKFHETHNITIVSADQDIMQLLRYKTVKLIDPASGKERSLKEYNDSADLFMMVKCFRGDTGDNVGSAYPRLRRTKIDAAFEDPYLFTQLMEHTWTNQNGEEMLVKDLYEENKLLMDLSAQPQTIRDLIDDVIEQEMEDPGKYSHFHFLKFCGRFDLKKIADGAERFVPLLSC